MGYSREVTSVGGTSKMDAFWRRWGTQGTLKAPLEAVLERGADFRRFFGAFLEALGDPLAPLVSPGDPTLAIFWLHGRHFAAPGRYPRHHAEKSSILLASRCQKVTFSEGADSEYIYIYI